MNDTTDKSSELRVIAIEVSHAVVLASALRVALIVTRDQLERKSSKQFAPAIGLQLAAYEGELARIVKYFPEADLQS